MSDYKMIEKKGEFGTVYKARDLRTQQLVAIKQVPLNYNEGGVPSRTIREIAALRKLCHKNIVRLLEIVVSETDGRLYLVFEYVSVDLKHYLGSCLPKNAFLQESVIKHFMYQLLNGIRACHDRRVMHRNLTSKSILVGNQGSVKIAGFSCAHTYSIPQRRNVDDGGSLWYSAPEFLLGSPFYCVPVDIWSLGCIFAELHTKKPLFQGDSQIGQLFKIFQMLGSPSEDEWPEVSALPYYNPVFPKWKRNTLSTSCSMADGEALDLLQSFFIYDPFKRITARQALEMPYFNDYNPRSPVKVPHLP